jgi:hypothetical protein
MRGLVLAMLALMFVACSGGSSGPTVAQLSSQPGASASGGSGVLAFAGCMRTHGVTNFPDPGGQLPAGLDPSSPQYVAAQGACQSLLPQGTGGGPPPADREAALEYLACIRADGFPNDLTRRSVGGKHGIYEIGGTPHARGEGRSP